VVTLPDGGDIGFAVHTYLAGEGAEFVAPIETIGAFTSAIRRLH
jgi:hypothetical protein